MTCKYLDWCRGMVLTNCRVDLIPLRGLAKRDVATDHEHINVRPARLLFEPGLLHGSADGRDDGGVGVASEVDYG